MSVKTSVRANSETVVDDVEIQNQYCWLLFIIRVKQELKRVYRNGCRYDKRLNAETGGSRTPHTHWVDRVNIQ